MTFREVDVVEVREVLMRGWLDGAGFRAAFFAFGVSLLPRKQRSRRWVRIASITLMPRLLIAVTS